MRNLIDSHCHLQELSQSTLALSFENPLSKFICNATSQQDWAQVLNLRSEQVIPCIGIHPWYLNSATEDWEPLMRELISQPDVHVGEIGLDNYKVKISPKPMQDFFFKKQLKIAQDYRKVANIHCVSAYGKLFDILKETSPTGDLKILLHSWEGPWEFAERILVHFRQNVVFSLSMVSLSKTKSLEVVRKMPLENIVIETDSPAQGVKDFVTSEEVEMKEGKVLNKPYYLKYVFSRLAEVKEVDENALEQILNSNFHRIFGSRAQ